MTADTQAAQAEQGRARLRRAPHGADDVLVSGAPAQVALEPFPDLLVARVGVAAQQVSRGHDHPWGAVAALERVLGVERLLQRVPLPVGHALDRGDRRAVGLHREDGAAFHRFAVQVDRARAAVGRVASDGGTDQAEPVPQVVHQQQAGLHVVDIGDPVDRDGDVRHGQPLLRQARDAPEAKPRPDPGGRTRPVLKWR